MIRFRLWSTFMLICLVNSLAPNSWAEKNILVSSQTGAVTQNDVTTINADYMEYEEEKGIIYCRGNVQLTTGTMCIKSNEMTYDMNKEYVIAVGSVSVTGGDIGFKGEKMEYDLKTEKGDIYDIEGFTGEWFFMAKTAVKEKEVYRLKRCRLSTCEIGPPHYYFKISSAKLIPDDRIGVSNPWLWLWGIPTPIYFPWYSYSLKEERGCLEIFPEYNSYNGLVVKIKYSYLLWAGAYARLYFDSFEKQGTPGKGIEFNYSSTATCSGRFYAYHTEDRQADRERWKLEAKHIQKLSPTWMMRGNLNFTSDEEFNSVYNRDDWNRVDKKIKSNIGFTKKTSKTSLTIAAERFDVYNTTDTKYDMKSYSMPKVSFALNPITPEWSPASFGFNANLGRQYQGGPSSHTYWNSQLNERFTFRSLNLSRNDSITPSFGLTQKWRSCYEVIKSSFYRMNFNTGLNYRHSFGYTANLNVSHNLQGRFRDNSFDYDLEADDYGLDTNNINFRLSILPTSALFLGFNRSINIKQYRTKIVDWSERFTPLNFNSNLSFSIKKTAFHLIYSQDIEPYKFKSLSGDMNYKISEGAYFNFGFSHFSPGKLNIRTSFGFWLGGKCHLEVSQNNGSFDNNVFRSQAKELCLYHSLHCWEVRVKYKERGQYGTSNFNYGTEVLFGLKMGRRVREKMYDKEHEFKFSPWRRPEMGI